MRTSSIVVATREPNQRPAPDVLARASAAIAAGFGFIALLGWILELPMLTSLGPGWIPMAPSTALLFLLYGAAVFFCAGTPLGRGAYRIGITIASAGALVALLLLVLSLLGIVSEAEHLGIAIAGASSGKPLGHMSPLAALCFVLAGLSLLAALSSSRDRPRRAMAGFVFACLLIFASTVFLLAYLFGTPVLYSGKFIPPALTTSLAFAALGAGLWVLAGSRAWATDKGDDRIDAASLRASRSLILVFTLVGAGLVSAGYLYFQHHEKDYRAQAEQQLSAIADLKLSELLAYRKERLADGADFYRNAAFAALMRRAFDHPDDAQARAGLREWLARSSAHFQYDRAVLLDAQGTVRMSAPESPLPLDSVIARHAADLLRSGKVGFQDFHRNEHDQRIYLTLLVPIFDGLDQRRALGTLALRIDPGVYLYPFINRWPVPSLTAETLLVRRDGDDVLFLNELRFRNNTALSLRIPLTGTNNPAVKAVLGQEGIVEGLDYRGVPVIASVRRVPDSPWLLVARMDIAEALAPGQEALWLATGLVGALLLGGGAVVGLIWRQQRLRDRAQRTRTAEALAAAAALRAEVAERKKANDALEASSRDLRRSNAELEQFAYVASHDLQEPLRMVVGYVQLLQQRLADKLDADTREFMGFAVDGALRMQNMIEDILAYSRVGTRGQPLAQVNSASALDDALARLAGRVAETGAEVNAQSLPTVSADRAQLVQLFQNLIGNAIKFCKGHAPRVRVEAHREARQWRFSVSDNGIGIAPEYRERIFGVFKRLHTQREFPGTGIGLAICKRIIQRHGGEMGVESAPGGGSVFWFTLPEETSA